MAVINLLDNAVKYSPVGSAIHILLEPSMQERYVKLAIADEGPGIPNAGNLFVPFFTTKPSGSGIGLVLSRQIAEAHRGTVTLENVREGHGCEARLRLPVVLRKLGP